MTPEARHIKLTNGYTHSYGEYKVDNPLWGKLTMVLLQIKQ